ncbi:MAG TPA: restriction endonuclease [Chloroflexota bacterium]|nr:restriction endonuclease [Chloroflexota bacterium]
MRRLALAEHQTARGVRLTRVEREALQETIPEVAVTPTRGAGAGPARFDVTPGSWVGVAQVTLSLLVEIAPKLPVSRVLFLLTYARDSRGWKLGDLTALEKRSDLVATVVGLFCAEVQRSLRFGLVHGYQPREELLHTLRGRVCMEERARRHIGVPATCAYDELTADIPENRVLKAALTQVSCLPIHAAARARRLLAGFAGVSDLADALSVPPIEPTRMNGRLQPALDLARLILGGAGIEANAGRTSAPSILFDMDRIFEDFVVAALRRALGLTEWTFLQGAGRKRLSLDRAGTLPLAPDFSWWEAGRCVSIGDAKYKRTTRGEHADLYQLLAYTSAANLSAGLLIYAAGEEPGKSHTHEVRHGDKTLHVAALDLATPPRHLLEQIDCIAQTARRLKSVAGRSAA